MGHNALEPGESVNGISRLDLAVANVGSGN